ncbi:MAG: hypothetical protein YFSK_3210 [Candidatus Yanofskyibacterium parasiticum]|nr:MAG: hypothetical protein YFSK_3210 [Candidatus Yanofskybacteria bacterium]
MNSKSIFKLILIAGAFAIFLPKVVLGIAQSVDPIIIESAQRGEIYETTVSVFNTDLKEATINLKGDGEIKDWVSFYELKRHDEKIESLVVPPQTYGYAIARFLVPKETANRNYEGNILASTVPTEQSQKNTASAVMQVSRKVIIKVGGTQNLRCEAEIILQNLYLGAGEPFKFSVNYHNKGNVSIEPFVKLQIMDGEAEVTNIVFPFSEKDGSLLPMGSKKIEYSWNPPVSEKKEYQANVSVFVEKNKVAVSSVKFSVNDPDYKAKQAQANLVNVFDDKNGVVFYVLIVIAGLVIILAMITIRNKSRKGNKSEIANSNQ